MSTLFISHASADQALVGKFVDSVIRLGCGVGVKRIFYSSGRDTWIPTGQDLNGSVREKLRDGGLVVAIVTPAFLESPYCLTELGAAWVAAGTLVPLILPSMSHDDLGGVLKGVIVRSLDDPGALDELHDRIKTVMRVNPKATTWGQRREEWLAALPGLLRDHAGSSSRLTAAASDRASYPVAVGAGGEGRYQWGDLFDSVVDAAFYMRDDPLARADIEQHILLGTLIPSRYHYSTDAGAKTWLRMCEDPNYLYHVNTTEFWGDSRGSQMAARIHDEVGSDVFDFISLGPGDGHKDADIVTNWLRAGVDLLYYPYDVSLPLASRAVQRVRTNTRDVSFTGTLRIKAVLADFEQLRTMRQVFRHRAATNVVGLLGSLGNLERELAFLRGLHATLEPRDLVVLEVRLKSGTDLSELFPGIALQHDFGPLEYYLNLPFDPDRVIKEEAKKRISTIPRTKTIKVSYRGPVSIDGRDLGERNVQLQYIHLYEPDALLAKVSEAGFDVVEKFVDEEGAFLECLLRRRP